MTHSLAWCEQTFRAGQLWLDLWGQALISHLNVTVDWLEGSHASCGVINTWTIIEVISESLESQIQEIPLNLHKGNNWHNIDSIKLLFCSIFIKKDLKGGKNLDTLQICVHDLSLGLCLCLCLSHTCWLWPRLSLSDWLKTTTHLVSENSNDVRVYLHIERVRKIWSKVVSRDAWGDSAGVME